MNLFSGQGISEKIVELVAGSLQYFERPDRCHKIAAKEGYILRAPFLPKVQTTKLFVEEWAVLTDSLFACYVLTFYCKSVAFSMMTGHSLADDDGISSQLHAVRGPRSWPTLILYKHENSASLAYDTLCFLFCDTNPTTRRVDVGLRNPRFSPLQSSHLGSIWRRNNTTCREVNYRSRAWF